MWAAWGSGSIVMSGGVEIVVSGGTASGTTINGGLMEVQGGGSVGSSTITFSGGGTLQLDDSVHFSSGLVAGFGLPDMLDLRDIAFISGTTSVHWQQLTSGSAAGGTLTVGDGSPATTANITLLGQYAAGNFNIQNDGAGGTLVTDPPISTTTGSNPLTLAQHA
jgi:autotransporter passenger strand-loop-strand repeat protein